MTEPVQHSFEWPDELPPEPAPAADQDAASETELDPVKRAALFIKMNDLVIQDVVVIPVLWRSVISAVSNRLKNTEITGWDSNLWNLANWTREG